MDKCFEGILPGVFFYHSRVVKVRTRLFVLEDLHELRDADDLALDVLDILADSIVEDGG